VINTFSILKNFQDINSYFSGVWVDPATGRLRTGSVYVRQDVRGVGEVAQRAIETLLPYVERMGGERKDIIERSLTYLRDFFPKDNAIQQAVTRWKPHE
jgi:hypothetical protein